MFNLPNPPPPPPADRPKTIDEIAAGYESLVNTAAHQYKPGEPVAIGAPEGMAPSQYLVFWRAVSANMVGTGWTLAPTTYRDAGASRFVVPA